MRCSLLLLAACVPTTETLTDAGFLCIDGNEVVLLVDPCVREGCDTLTEATCRVTSDGSVLQLTSRVVIERGSGDDCPDPCTGVEIRCPLPEDAARVGRIAFGGTELALAGLTCEG